VLHHRNEELLVIFSNADLDHTSTIDKVRGRGRGSVTVWAGYPDPDPDPDPNPTP